MDILLDYVEKVESLKDKYCPELSLAQYAIRFCLSNHAVSTVMPGMRKPEQVLHNIQAIDKGV
jgi:predicted aldo/keto reductase-like oxidoreductase